MYKNRTINVVMPALNEELGIQKVIQDFESLGFIDEIIVVDNGSVDGTRAVVNQTSAKLILEPRRGYGRAVITGLEHCHSDLIVLTESDGTFRAEDLLKLLAYIDEFDMVKGARSNLHLISKEAEWRLSLQIGNLFVSKVMALLYFGPRIYQQSNMREMGGTFRVLTRDSLATIQDSLSEEGSAFLADLTSLYLRKHLKVLELPIHYLGRMGVSKITGSHLKTLLLGVRMLIIIIKNRIHRGV
jgi:glycosyltransferase involved in cell wall biosynthesis